MLTSCIVVFQPGVVFHIETAMKPATIETMEMQPQKRATIKTTWVMLHFSKLAAIITTMVSLRFMVPDGHTTVSTIVFGECF